MTKEGSVFISQNLQQVATDYLAQLRKPADPKKDVKSKFMIIKRTLKRIAKLKYQFKRYKKLYSLASRKQLLSF